mmetsp:Transcript_31290/g.61995  ORF Transcript_31290/g.61995 Transcript_31290/m.61995 type:complete len:223 (-) Transcript_31290:259-927(-)
MSKTMGNIIWPTTVRIAAIARTILTTNVGLSARVLCHMDTLIPSNWLSSGGSDDDGGGRLLPLLQTSTSTTGGRPSSISIGADNSLAVSLESDPSEKTRPSKSVLFLSTPTSISFFLFRRADFDFSRSNDAACFFFIFSMFCRISAASRTCFSAAAFAAASSISCPSTSASAASSKACCFSTATRSTLKELVSAFSSGLAFSSSTCSSKDRARIWFSNVSIL